MSPNLDKDGIRELTVKVFSLKDYALLSLLNVKNVLGEEAKKVERMGLYF